MLLKTYNKMIDVFHIHHGYMSFDSLRREKITVLQIKELEEMKIIERFARGWYWCSDCGYSKPSEYKYIELAKVNPESVICMDSACYLHGIIKKEPDVISVSTIREDRRKMELEFPIQRFYLKNTGEMDEIQTVITDFGNYKKYSLERSICDCFRIKNKLDEDTYLEIVDGCKRGEYQKERLIVYAKALHAPRCIDQV